MLGERTEQRELWEADRMYLDYVGRDTFYGLLASLRGQLFRDADFAELYCLDNGRTSVPPSLLATALLLQTYDKVSDAAAKARADFDIRWKVALGIEIEDRPFAKSTRQVFRGQLILHDQVREVFERSLQLAREAGYLKKRSMRVALDTTYILGRGAEKDTYNLLADGIVKLMRALAVVDMTTVGQWAEVHGYERYVGSSVKGAAVIDWSSQRERRKLLAEIVADADRLLELGWQAQGELPEGGVQRREIVEAAELLGQLLLQDVERKGNNGDGDGEGVSLKEGVSRDRMLSVPDPELRHGRKSSSKRFDGHKAAIVVDTDTQLITAVDVLPGTPPTTWGHWTWWSRAKPMLGSRLPRPWGTPPTATAGRGKRLLKWDVSWWPKRRGGPTGSISPRMTSTLTWRQAVAPVRRARLPAPSCRRESGRIAPVVSIDCRLSSSTGRYVGYVHCAPSASRPKAGRDGGCKSIPREACCNRPGPGSKAPTTTRIERDGW